MEDKLKLILNNTEKGLNLGLKSMNIGLGGIQRGAIYAIGAAPKVGKTTFVDFCFLLSPYLTDFLERGINIHWIYFSFEISRIRKMFKIAPFFFIRDFNKSKYVHKGKEYPITSTYLMNKQLDKDEELIIIKEDDKAIFEQIYNTRLVPLFGKVVNNEWSKGVVDIIERPENPTGLRNYIYNYASEHGRLLTEPYTTIIDGKKVTKTKIIDYIPNNPKEFVIIITDHIRKLKFERGYTMKQNIDKWLEYQVEMRNLFNYTFIDIAHLNRNLDDIERMKFTKDLMFPGLGDFKDSGNAGEEADYVITGFDPRDKKYMLKTHFGHELIKYPNYRSWHIVASRDGENFDVFTEINGGTNTFNEI